MSERATLDQYIETLQILAREGDAERTDAERERDAAHRAKLIDAFAHELAEQQRMWALDYDGAEDDSSYDYTYALVLGAKLAADLIDPGAGLVRPDEEPTP